MSKIKLTRNELKIQRESLSRYARYLPTLELKKIQLQVERRRIQKDILELEKERGNFLKDISPWKSLFSENYPKTVLEIVKTKEVLKKLENIAGIEIPIFKDIQFEIDEFNKFTTPPWFEKGIEAVKKLYTFEEQIKIFEEQLSKITEELNKTTQRINLFKEKLIPECKENIRLIRIHLGDQLAASVGRSKIAKQKMKQK